MTCHWKLSAPKNVYNYHTGAGSERGVKMHRTVVSVQYLKLMTKRTCENIQADFAKSTFNTKRI